MVAKPVVVVTRPDIPDSCSSSLRDIAELRLYDCVNLPEDRQRIRDLVSDADAIIGGGVRFDEDVIGHAPRLRIIALASAGYDAVDRAAAHSRGIAITNAPGVLQETTADLTMTIILLARRKLVPALEWVRAGRWTSMPYSEFLGQDVWGASLGLVGYGQIGQSVARRAAGFGMTVRHSLSRRLSDSYSSRVTLGELLAKSDIVSLHVPLVADTRLMVDDEFLRRMKDGSTFVNTARGAIVNELALLESLESGHIASAGLDVLSTEPPGTNKTAMRLIQHPRVVVTPHVGSATVRTRTRMFERAVSNVRAVLAGEEPPDRVPEYTATGQHGSGSTGRD